MADGLEAQGYPAVRASDGVEVLEYLRTGAKPCVLFLDLRMPRMDGFELLRRLRAEPELAGFHTAVMTAHNSRRFPPSPL